MTLKELKHHRKIAVENLYFKKKGKDYWRKELDIINQLINGQLQKNTTDDTDTLTS
jgi:hypothetical protein